MLQFNGEVTLADPPRYYREVQQQLRSHEFQALEMDEHIDNVLKLGLTLEAANPRAGMVNAVNVRQARKQGVKVGDYVAKIGGWWLPPWEHPRRAELVDILRGRFTGTVAKNLKTVPGVFVRVGTEDELKQEQNPNEAQVVHIAPIATAVLAPSNLLETPKTEVTEGQC